MAYIDCYVLPIQADKVEAYRALATESAALWLKHGALSVTEALADDAPMGKLTSFPRSVQMTPDEVVVCAHITYRDRAHRDAVMARAMGDTRMEEIMQNAPIYGKRMIWGGFNVIVSV